MPFLIFAWYSPNLSRLSLSNSEISVDIIVRAK